MLTNEQHERLKKLVKMVLTHNAAGFLYDGPQRKHAIEDMADIIDPEHWTRGEYHPTRQPSPVLLS